MPDLWDTNPRNAFGTPDEQPDLAPDDHDHGDDHTKEVMLKDHRGHLPPPGVPLDRAGDLVGGSPALDRRHADRAQIAPVMPSAYLSPPGQPQAWQSATTRHRSDSSASGDRQLLTGNRCSDLMPIQVYPTVGRAYGATRWRPRHPVLRCCYGALERRATVLGVQCNPKPQVSMGM